MNRSFLIIIVPGILVAIGYIVVLRWLGYELEPFRFIVTGVIGVVALLLVLRSKRRKASKRGP